MNDRITKSERKDLEKIASRLGSIHLIVIPGDQELLVRATAKFDPARFQSGEYEVAIGLNEAHLVLDHPSFDSSDFYEATLDKSIWSENFKSEKDSLKSGGVEGKAKFSLPSWLTFSGGGKFEAKKQETTEQKASARYPIISATPRGWRIGTELGDPRDPQGVLPDGLEHCLVGAYLSGQRGEMAYNQKNNSDPPILCRLTPKAGGNDPYIVATIYGACGALRIRISRRNENVDQGCMSGREDSTREEKLRESFVKICIERAAKTFEDGLRPQDHTTGEFYLNRHEIMAPKLSPSSTREPPSKRSHE